MGGEGPRVLSSTAATPVAHARGWQAAPVAHEVGGLVAVAVVRPTLLSGTPWLLPSQFPIWVPGVAVFATVPGTRG
jgi:hypothetical protein